MTVDQLITQIESQAFNAYLSAASGFRVFYNALLNHDSIQQLTELVNASGDALQKLNTRLNKLLMQETNENFQHFHDIAISAYLVVLYETDKQPKAEIADIIMNTPTLWWARQVVKRIQEVSGEPSTPLFEN